MERDLRLARKAVRPPAGLALVKERGKEEGWVNESWKVVYFKVV